MPLLSAPTIFAILIVSRSTTRVALGRRWPLSRVRVILVGLGLLTVLVALRIDRYRQLGLADPAWLFALGQAFSSALAHPSAPVLAAGLGLYLWWRGITHGRSDVIFEDVADAFRLGIAALVGFLLLAAVTHPESRALLQVHVGAFVVGFLFASLTSLSLAGLADVRGQRRIAGDRPFIFNRQWLAVMLSVIVALLLLTLLLARLLAFDLIATVASPLLDLLANAAWLLLWAIAIPVGYLLEAIIFLVRLLIHPGAPPTSLEPVDLSFLEQLQREGAPRGLPPEVAFAAKWAIIGLAGSAVVAMLARAMFRWHGWDQDEEVVEERESVWMWDYLWAAALAWLRSFRMRFSLCSTVATSVAATTAGVVTGPPLIVTVRQIYRQLLRLGASFGARRASYETPYEHLPRLQASIEPAEDVVAITEAYVKARYSLAIPLDGEIQDLQARWDRILAWSAAASPRTMAQDKGETESGRCAAASSRRQRKENQSR